MEAIKEWVMPWMIGSHTVSFRWLRGSAELSGHGATAMPHTISGICSGFYGFDVHGQAQFGEQLHHVVEWIVGWR
jgi:hypothetical protein